MTEESNKNILESIPKTDNFKFENFTTYGLGGSAKCAYFPETEQQAAYIFKYLNESKENTVILGNGSNILASDSYFGGSVICTKNLHGIIKNKNSIYCLSGTTVKELLNFCINENIGGFEYLAGIPASIGGLALMNGGIPEKHISEDILNVRLCTGEILEFSNAMCDFGDKHSTMRDINCLILGVELVKRPSDAIIIKENIKKYLALRRMQPNGKSCGCVFKNPHGKSAGMLIDRAGLKGLKYGGAEVSQNHANFIINKGGTANDVYKLIKIVKQRVFDYSGIALDEEVVYIGEFNDFDS